MRSNREVELRIGASTFTVSAEDLATVACAAFERLRDEISNADPDKEAAYAAVCQDGLSLADWLADKLMCLTQGL